MIAVDTTEALAGQIRDAVLAVPGVARLAPGSAVEVATQFAGGKVVGLRLAGPVVEVHVVVDALPVRPVADRVADAAGWALTAAGDPRPVQVVVADVDDAAFAAVAARAPGAPTAAPRAAAVAGGEPTAGSGVAAAGSGVAAAGSGMVPTGSGTVGR